MNNVTALIKNNPEKKIYAPETARAFTQAAGEFVLRHPADANIAAIRARGLRQIELQGLPSRRLESWKYTDPGPALKNNYEVKTVSPTASHPTQQVNPAFVAVLSQDYPGQEVDGQLWALNQAFLDKPYMIEVGKGEELELELIWNAGEKDVFSSPRTVIILKKGARLHLTEIIQSGEKCWFNLCTQIIVESGAKLCHFRLQGCGNDSFCTLNTMLRIERDGCYEHHFINLGARIGRNQYHVSLEGENASCRINGVNLLDGERVGDATVTVRHKAENGFSMQNIRSVLLDQARGVFQGAIQVEREAQKTNAHQLSKALMLSEGAEMDTRPELEIFADDVKCSHGATTGQIDREAMFYLRSRGLNEAQAKKILMSAFVSELLESIDPEKTKDLFIGRVEDWLDRSG